jgi:hypothetical protein
VRMRARHGDELLRSVEPYGFVPQGSEVTQIPRELNRTIREIFPLIRESALVRFFGICFADKCDRPDTPRLCREGEEGTVRCSKPPKPISRSKPAFCPGERRARHSPKFGRRIQIFAVLGVGGFMGPLVIIRLVQQHCSGARSRP